MEKAPNYIPPKKVSRKFLAIVIAVIIIASGAGIGVYLYLHPAKKEPTLVVLVDSGSDTQQYLTEVAKNYESANPGVEIKIDSVGYSDLVSTSLAALKDKGTSPGLIMYYPSGEPTLAPYLMNLSNSGFNLSNYLPGELYDGSYVLSMHGNVVKTVGIPIHTVLGYVLVYQNSIFDNKTLQTDFENEYHFSIMPNTYKNWTAVYDASSYISSKMTSLENKYPLLKYPLMFPDSSHHSMIDAYLGLLYGYGSNHTDVTGISANSGAGYSTYMGSINGKYQPTFNNTYGVQALEMYKNLTSFEPNLKTTPIGYDEQETLFPSGEYAMGLAWTSFLPGYSNSTISKVAGNYNVSILPDGGTGYAPTYMGVNPYTNTSLAIKFLKFALSDKEYKIGIDKNQYLPGTISGLEIAEKNQNFTWVHALITSASSIIINKTNVAVYDKLQALFTTLTPDLNDEIFDYFTGTETAPAALNKAAMEWSTYIKSSGISL
ncbi:MAG: extracellular solute-binding protein [Ferroplasma sp.]